MTRQKASKVFDVNILFMAEKVTSPKNPPILIKPPISIAPIKLIGVRNGAIKREKHISDIAIS